MKLFILVMFACLLSGCESLSTYLMIKADVPWPPVISYTGTSVCIMQLKFFIIALLSYLAGCLNAGYYYVRIFHNKDIRLLGTGTAGARNAGRLYGPRIFTVVFLMDFTKGAVLTLLGLWIDLGYAAVCAVAVVVGHIWPIQLRFQGGKGVASALGALLFLAPMCLLVIAVSSVILRLLGQTLVRSGIAGFWLAVGVSMLRYESMPIIIAVTILALLHTLSHRHNLGRKI